MDDQQILELFGQRSEAAITQLHAKYGSPALQLAKRILRSNQDAEECVSDAMYTLWQRIPPEKPAHLWAYFSRIVRNLCCDRLDHLRAAKRDQTCQICLSELEVCFAHAADPQAILESRYIAQAINTFLDHLEPTSRILFVRRYYYFDSCQEIARRMGMTLGAVNTRLSRLRKQLRTQLEKEDIFL